MRRSALATAAFLAAATPMTARAATIEFTGSRTNVDAPGPAAARCGTRATTNVVHNPAIGATSAGASNLGAFIPTLQHCIQLPLSAAAANPFDLGEFTFDFGAGDTLFGTYSGFLTFASPGLFNVFQTHVVTGGTGFFDGASGGFESSGVLSFPGGRPTVTQTFAGRLVAPAAVPEPGTWAMLIAGFGVLGAAMRRRRMTLPADLLASSGR